jgi:DNA-binding GntR family transcriptional regulator
MVSEPILRQSLHAAVADRVRARIFAQELPASARIDETALCAALGISRTPLREALKVLASEGLVRLVPGKGAFVTELDPRDIDELFPVMAMLEGRCAFDAVLRMTAADARRLADLHDRLERHAAAGDVDAYYAVNDTFHQSLETLAGNPWLIRVTAELRRFLRLSRGRQLTVPGRMDASLSEHRALLAAVARRDAAGAERLMQHHLLAQREAWRVLHADVFAPPDPLPRGGSAAARAGATGRAPRTRATPAGPAARPAAKR